MTDDAPPKLEYESPPEERRWPKGWIEAVVIVIFLVVAATVLVA